MTSEPQSLSAVVLAAGQGTRMRSDLPKVLQPLAGRPLLGHVLSLCKAMEVAQTVVVYGFGGDQVKDAFADQPLDWALQAEQLGTGHAVQQAMAQIDDEKRVLILCGDVPLLTVNTLQRLVTQTPPDAVGVLTVDVDNPTGYGRIVRDSAGHVQRIVEEKDATDAEKVVAEINSGVFVVPAALLRGWLKALRPQNAQGEYYLTDIVSLAVADQVSVIGVRADNVDEIMGINDRIQLAEAERIFQRRAVEKLMRAGARVADPARVDVRGVVACGRDVFIDVNVVFQGNVVLGDRAIIGPNCVITDSSIGADTQIFANSFIEQSSIGTDSNIGPFARLRPESNLGNKTKVGNFVEIKKSEIADGSKVNHLTYIGDTTIGERVNVGAGTITCNYDGANKHRTIIGDDVFVGSGVQLVAPIEIGTGATIGAGSTISKMAPGNQLTLSRAAQKSIDGWQRPVKKT